MRDVVAWALAIFIAIPAQALMFAAEWVGERADEWID